MVNYRATGETYNQVNDQSETNMNTLDAQYDNETGMYNYGTSDGYITTDGDQAQGASSVGLGAGQYESGAVGNFLEGDADSVLSAY